MAFSPQFLDEVRSRTVLSALVGRSVTLKKAGHEFKGCCPVHHEKTPSFTVNDDKGFAHCFGCGYHADAFRWLEDFGNVGFVDAVKELAAAAGLEIPAESPERAEQAKRIETVRFALDAAQETFSAQLGPAGAVMEYLSARGIGPADIAGFGLGYARAGDGSLKGKGIGQKLGLAAGLFRPHDSSAPGPQVADGGRALRETFFDRITVPIHDARGRLVGFGGRVWPGRRGDTPKFLNSPQSPIFDKGRLLFNLHRARAYARPPTASLLEADGSPEGRLLVVEGYFDVIALASVGIRAAVAPMGTALTDEQLQRLWRVHHRPVLLFDGDAAGIRAGIRAAKMALPHLGPGHELAVALLPEGRDPDDLVRSAEGRDAIETVIAAARPLHEFLFDAVVRGEA